MKLPPIMLINLKSGDARLREFKEWNPHICFSLFEAVDGRSVDRQALVNEGIVLPNLEYGPGTLGCALSHIRLWQIAAETQDGLTILEDDTVVCSNFTRIAEVVLKYVGRDWDFIKWGFNFMPAFAWIDAGVSKARLQQYGSEVTSNRALLINYQQSIDWSAPVPMLHSFGFMGYSISSNGAKKALEHCLPLQKRFMSFPDAGVVTKDIGIDVALSGYFPSMKAYLCLPQLVVVNGTESVREAIDRPT
jgi:GR25 family glycosyltransferase involved in LPS biosynthesis